MYDLTGPSELPVAGDLETTGLHPVLDHILEFDIRLLDRKLNLVADFGSRVIHTSETQLERMNDYVRDMHTKNGLLEEVRASTRTLADVDAEVAAWLLAHGIDGVSTQGIFLGSSCRLDLYMIELQMPKTAALLTHRMIDVSGFRKASELYVPEIQLDTAAPNADGNTASNHRTGADIDWTIREARAQRHTMQELCAWRLTGRVS